MSHRLSERRSVKELSDGFRSAGTPSLIGTNGDCTAPHAESTGIQRTRRRRAIRGRGGRGHHRPRIITLGNDLGLAGLNGRDAGEFPSAEDVTRNAFLALIEGEIV